MVGIATIKKLGGIAIVQNLASNVSTASTMQMVGNSKLLVYKPGDSCPYLMEYYQGLGRKIETTDCILFRFAKGNHSVFSSFLVSTSLPLYCSIAI
jgi:hypothetical protein